MSDNSTITLPTAGPEANVPPVAFHVMVKPRGAICNLDCKYCYFLSKEMLYPGSHFRMADELLERYTRQYIEAQHVPEVTFSWQGGEPTLMGLDFFRRALELQQKYCKPGMRVFNAIQTNGTTVDEQWCVFYREHNFLVGLSMDGPEGLHDYYRVDKGGQPTHARVMAAVRQFQRHGVEFNILCTVHAANARHPLDVYRFLRDDVGAPFVQFIPIVERDNDTGYQEGTAVTERSVTAQQYGQFLIGVFDEWVRRDVGQVYVQIFDVSLSAWAGCRPGLCVFEPTCGAAMTIEHNGDVYSCDHFVEPRHLLGNIGQDHLGDLVASPQQFQFGQNKHDRLPRYCRECEVRFICNGGCPKNRFIHTPDGEPGLNYLCAGYQTFFKHIDEPMRVMTAHLQAGRPPALVMDYLRTKDA